MREIKVQFDEKRALPVFNPEEFETWELVVGVLQMAVDEAKFQLNMAKAQAMQQMAMRAQEAVAIRNKLKI